MHTTDEPPRNNRAGIGRRRRGSRHRVRVALVGALGGIVAAGTALALGYLVANLTGGPPGPGEFRI